MARAGTRGGAPGQGLTRWPPPPLRDLAGCVCVPPHYIPPTVAPPLPKGALSVASLPPRLGEDRSPCAACSTCPPPSLPAQRMKTGVSGQLEIFSQRCVHSICQPFNSIAQNAKFGGEGGGGGRRLALEGTGVGVKRTVQLLGCDSFRRRALTKGADSASLPPSPTPSVCPAIESSALPLNSQPCH